MILVKSLIGILLLILGFYIYDHLHLLAYFDGREGFKSAGASGAGSSAADEYTTESIMKASKALANETIELKFSEKMPLDMHKDLANDAEEMSKLQEKMNELLKLKDQAKEINKKIYEK